MEAKDFKKFVSHLLVEKGFEKKRNFFYRRDTDLIYVIGIQKSKYSNGFYLNVGYLIRALHPENDFPKDVDGDVRTRFSIMMPNSKSETDIIELENLSKDQTSLIEDFVFSNVDQLIDSVQSNGLVWLLEKDPTLLYQTTLKAKEYLEIA